MLQELTKPTKAVTKPVDENDRIKLFKEWAETGKLPSLVPLLPLVLNLNGKPYTLHNHFPLEPLFRTRLPRQSIQIAGRQISKSTSMAAVSLIRANAIPYFSILFVTPLYEQVRRFSNNYVRKFIEESPLKNLWCGTHTENSVLQRSFMNRSQLFFSFALADADRVRGISSHATCIDELQDMDGDLIPVIEECMSASPWHISMYSGTPKTLDNPIEGRWLASSQAEWAIVCTSCKKLNIPRMGYDLERMIGPWHEDIGLVEKGKKPATICANSKCGLPIDPRNGFWLHEKPERRAKFPGYHIPQIIMPMHYADPDKWSELLAKQAGYNNFTIVKFYNEVLGESYDVGAKLITKTDLESASVLTWENKPKEPTEAASHKREYVARALGVDWGGGGEDEVSFTTMAVLGLRADGRLDVIYGRRLLTPHDHLGESSDVMQTFNMFECNMCAHDYNGAGSLRETVMIQAGMPYSKVVPFVYTRSASKNIITLHKSEQQHSRNYWLVDKTRALQLVCQCIKLKWIRLFKHDYVSEEQLGLQHDFLALVENKVEMPRGPDVYMIQRNPHYPDDFAHSVTYAACALWHYSQKWPQVAQIAGLQIAASQMQQINPREPWQEAGGFLGQP